MSKAILIVDMPKSCGLCKLCEVNIDWCNAMDISLANYEEYTKRPNWCPLKEVPGKKEPDSLTDSVYFEALGYNTCIDEILEGTEND